jgi:outer membrane protein OmpA-like peptidoglycan-associated protein
MRLPPIRFARTLTRAWPLASALAVVAAMPAAAQDTTVVGSGGADSGVTVNLNVLDNGATSAPRTTPQRARSGGQQLQLQPPGPDQGGGTQGQGADAGRDLGDRGPGPLGRVLLFPPMDHPKSRLLVDPDELAAQTDAQRRQAQQATAPEGRAPGTNGAADGGGQGQRQQSRESGMTAEGRAMAESAGANDTAVRDSGNARADRNTGQGRTQGAASTGSVPDAPDIADPPSPADGSGNQPDPVTPDTKPSAADRDGGGTAGTSESGGTATGTMAEGGAAETMGSGETAAQGARRDATGTTGAGEPGESATAQTAGGTASTTTGETQTASDPMPETSQSDAKDAERDAGGETDGTPARDKRQTADTQTTDGGSGSSEAGETQTAKRTAASGALPGKLQLDFETGSAKLSDSTRATLQDLASTLKETSGQRIQLMAYAKGGDDGASRARRLSLSRALAVRSFLIDQGIRSTRMDVRALGDTAQAGPLDRVDIVPANG